MNDLKENNPTLEEVINNKEKLDKIKSLEKELGCTFEIIIEAAKDVIIDSKGEEHQVVFDNYCLYVVEEDELVDSFNLKDYKKTWWLPSDKEVKYD